MKITPEIRESLIKFIRNLPDITDVEASRDIGIKELDPENGWKKFGADDSSFTRIYFTVPKRT